MALSDERSLLTEGEGFILLEFSNMAICSKISRISLSFALFSLAAICLKTSFMCSLREVHRDSSLTSLLSLISMNSSIALEIKFCVLSFFRRELFNLQGEFEKAIELSLIVKNIGA
ncbi:hypothetical protein GDO81_017828 [Engystomops pustulosus]|uniref:Uncharacterized protein n=1 Tax=Engystomops pustulosus TaxID=76066 RepID=A0AAV7A2L2_ENGPU|nr:hypothetical protein GDO81_017828 [Engystomops pustulosus]